MFSAVGQKNISDVMMKFPYMMKGIPKLMVWILSQCYGMLRKDCVANTGDVYKTKWVNGR